MSDSTAVPTVRPYEGMHEVGRGGSSVVYAANGPDGSTVAIKVFNVGAGDPAMRRRLDREAAALEALKDIPGVLAVLDHRFTTDGRPCLVMPFMSAGSLADEMAKRPLTTDRVLQIGTRTASALGEAHRRGIFHRDIKPANLLVDADGQTVIADFGIAAIGDLELASQTVASLSPPYAPPERFVDSGETASAAADIYSLAATLYALLVGAPPFGTTRDGGLAGLMTRVMSAPLPRLDHLDAPDALHPVLAQAMAKAPLDRYATMEGFAADLVALRSGRPLVALGATSVEGAARRDAAGAVALPLVPVAVDDDLTVRRAVSDDSPDTHANAAAVVGGHSAECDRSDEPDEGLGAGRNPRRALAGVAAVVALLVVPVAAWAVFVASDDSRTTEVAVQSETTIRGTTSTSASTTTTPPVTTAAPLEPDAPLPADPNGVLDLPGGPDAIGGAAPRAAEGAAEGGAASEAPATVWAPSQIELGPAQSIEATPPLGPAPQPTPAPGPTTAPKPGDINGDGMVGCIDLQLFSDDWGTTNPRSDFDGSGKVDAVDLNVLAFNFKGDGTSWSDGSNSCP